MSRIKKMGKLSIAAIAVSAALGTSPMLMAKSLTVTGTIETKSPTIVYSINKPVIEAFVESASINIREGIDSGCTLTTSKETAKQASNEDDLTCQYDFVAPFNTQKSSINSSSEWKLTGILDQIGAITIPITSTFYSGSANTPVVIPTKSVVIQTIAPIPLNVLDIEYVSPHAKGNGDIFEINTPDDSERIIVKVNTEVKDYDRVISLEGFKSCVILSGSDGPCMIDLSNYEFGSEDDRLGEITIPVTADAHNNYFEDNNLIPNKSITIKWDSRLPEFIQMASGDSLTENSITLDDGTVIKALDGTWIVVLKTPHHARADDWWHVSGRGRLSPSSAVHEKVPSIIIRSVDYSYLWKSRGNPSFNAITPTKTEYIGEYILLTYDVTRINSADYVVNYKFTDKLNNSIDIEKQFIVENENIEFISFTSGQQASDKTSAAYFPSDLQFALYSRFRDLTIQSVQIDGVDVTYEDVSGEGVHFVLSSFPTNFVSGDTLNLKVQVLDSKNKTHTFDTPFIIQPFKMDARYTRAYDEVQAYQVDLRQSNSVRGSRDCKLYDNEDAAKGSKYDFSSELHCYLIWEDLDPELSVKSMRSKYIIEGYAASSNPVYHYRVKFFDSKGNEALSDLKTLALESLELPEISLSIESGDIIEDDAMQAFAVPVAGGRVAEIRAKMINAEGEIVTMNPFGDDSTLLVKQSGTSINTEPRSLIRVFAEPGKIWDQANLTVKAGYSRTTKYDKTEQIRMVYVPDENVTALIDMDNFDIVNHQTFTMKTGIGVLNIKTKEFTYDANIHGEWDVTLQQYLGNKIYKDIGDVSKLLPDGTATFNIDPSNLIGEESYRYRIVADIKSEYAGYSRQIVGRVKTFKVHKGGEIDGFIDSSALEKTTPFRYRSDIEYASKADKKATGEIKWHYRNLSGNNWINVPLENPNRFEYTFVDTGSYEVRATVTNKFSGAISEITSETILAYQEVDAKLVYNATEYVNQPNSVELVVPDSASNYDVEWSEDKCETFTQGSTTYTFTRSEATRVDICARIAYRGTDQAGGKRWSETRKRITIKEPKPLYVKVKTSKTSEVGFDTNLSATILTDSNIGHSVESSWYRPNGTIIPSILTKLSANKYELTATYKVVADDLESFKLTKDFYVNAILPKVPESETNKNAKMAVLAYEFPTFEMQIDQKYIYAPTEANILIRMVEEPDVQMEFTYEWLNRQGNELVSSRDTRTGSRSRYKVQEAGLNMYAVIVKDERNNEVLYSLASPAEMPEPAVITLRKSYSNQEMRYPLDLVIRPRVNYQHNDDKTVISEYYVNGELLLTGKNGTKLYYTAEKAGEYNVVYKSFSKLGAVDESKFSFTVVPNQRPECEIVVREATTSYNFKAVCVDHDGKITAYLIEFLELGLAGSSREYRLTKKASALVGRSTFTIRLTVTDDSLEDTIVEKVYTVSSPAEK